MDTPGFIARTPGFTADSTLNLRTQVNREQLSEARQGTAMIIPAIWVVYPCYSRPDGGVGYCSRWVPDDVASFEF
jgi:hypothetical protein